MIRILRIIDTFDNGWFTCTNVTMHSVQQKWFCLLTED